MAKYSPEQLRAIFQRPFDQEAWKAIVRDVFKATSLRSKPEQFTLPGDPEQGYYFGAIDTSDNYRIGVFFYKISHGSVAHKKVGLRNLVKKFVNPDWGEFDAAIVVFSDGKEWRLSFVCDIKEEATAPKRFTFVFGEDDNFYRTAIERFNILQSTDASFENIRKAFSVEALSDDFFNQYRELYADFCQYITGKRYVKEGTKWVERELDIPNHQYSSTFENDDKLVRDYIKKMFGRIVFLYFLQRKGWLAGDKNYMHSLFTNSDRRDDFLDGVLEPLFFEVLNTDKQNRTLDAKLLPGSGNIPYLNGGLFARDEIDERTCVFPETYFKRLFDFLDSYNFTIDENDIDDAEVGIDPEMLGRIFENLLEDNKDKGAFYTPKEIVDYMCRESIIAYLQDDKFSAEGNDIIRQFVETMSRERLLDHQREYLRDKLKAVKICDPAIGSGAFPMGLVNLLTKLYMALGVNASQMALIKRHIIEQNIYGVDIEKGAVDIARLRFWLAMIVEEKEPLPLPNLHFKIMQGNSLLESYKGIDLSDLAKKNYAKNKDEIDYVSEEERKLLLKDLQSYYSTTDHEKRDEIFANIIKNVRCQIYDKGVNLPSGFDPSANDDFFLWHTWFADVFDNGGFDIVIGNPPYIQLQANEGLLGDLYESCDFCTYTRSGDIYCLFYEQGVNLLNQKGKLCFITSNKWMKANYGEKIRKFFSSSTNPILLVDFGGTKIFDNASVDTNILLVQKNENVKSTRCVKFDNVELRNLSEYIDKHHTLLDFSSYSGEIWVILSEKEKVIQKKIKDRGTPLKNWNIQIKYGIKTGYNPAFIIDHEIRDYILNNCETSEEKEKTKLLLKPLLRGRDIRNDGYEWQHLWLINTHNGIRGVYPRIDVNDYPSIKNHLDKYLNKLSKRADKGDTPYNLRNCAYIEDFKKLKLIYPDITQRLNFVLDESEYFLSNTAYFFTSDDENSLRFLSKVLNTDIIDWYYRTISVQLGQNALRMFTIYVLELPIPKEAMGLLREVEDKETIEQILCDFFQLTEDEKSYIKSIYVD